MKFVFMSLCGFDKSSRKNMKKIREKGNRRIDSEVFW